MNGLKYPKTAALIDIGSSEIRCQIAQAGRNGAKRLEALSYPLSLGSDVYKTGTIGGETARELIKALEGFIHVAKEYKTEQITAVATNALRLAKNKAFVLDQIKARTGLCVQVLEDNEEKALIYYEMLRTLRKNAALPKEKTLFAFLGAGSVGIAFYNGNLMYDSMTIPTGALQLVSMFRSIQHTTDDYGKVFSDYIHSMLTYDNLEEDCRAIRHVVFTGSMINLIASLTGSPFENSMYKIPVVKMRSLFEQIRVLRPDAVAMRFGISERTAEMLYLSLTLYLSLISFTNAVTVLSPRSDMSDCLICSQLVKKERLQYVDYLHDIILSCADTTARFYHCNPAHSDYILIFGRKLFDKLAPGSGLTQTDRTILELACILHECGHAISARNYLQSGYDAILHTDLIGATKSDMLLAATIARYNEMTEPSLSDPEFLRLPEAMLMRAAKLTAIFRVANALDNTHTEKLKEIAVKQRDDTLEILGRTNENMYLESYAFKQCAVFFSEVFGLKLRLKVKSSLN